MWTEEGVRSWGVPQANNLNLLPEHLAAMDALTRLPPHEQRLTFHLDGFDQRQAQIALLKAAYIAAFAALGYRYILRSALDVVRQQIREPHGEFIGRFHFCLSRLTPSARGIVAVSAPASLRCLMVRIDEHAIILPAYERHPLIYERLDARARWPLQPRTFKAIRGQGIAWPRRPEFLLDRPQISPQDSQP
jgi:hypothetical protein